MPLSFLTLIYFHLGTKNWINEDKEKSEFESLIYVNIIQQKDFKGMFRNDKQL